MLRTGDNQFFESVVDCRHRKGLSYAMYKKSCIKEEDRGNTYLSFYAFRFLY
jgi:hypothetical protein